MNKTLLIMAGGTGGHVYPGLACAEAWQGLGYQVAWIGTKKGIESNLVPAAGIDIAFINIHGLRGKGLLGILFAPFKIVAAIIQAFNIMRAIQPHAVLGMGGFAAGPGGIAAKLLRLPLIIHEQNAIAGTTNRILSKFATHVLQAFPSAFAANPKAITVGNPVRENIKTVSNRACIEGKFRVLVLGGSLGALSINQLMPKVYGQLYQDVDIWHQTGNKHIDATNAAYDELGLDEDAKVVAYIDDMSAALDWADFVVCRSGAMTVSELAVASKAAFLIPFPYAIDDHQSANAQWLVDAGAAIVMQESELNEEKLIMHIRQLIDKPEQLTKMQAAAKKVAIDNAVEQIIHLCEATAKK
ncbi:MAG: undecaprenyldiphospho-muramoylpentapeptide beta-N-acetylglucosaminyltransferase [Pseudomonadales bacterium]|nr:undecaprenyldiphospho-muramoylpentapeptide beta-N-acetylglucosaminyltransferase [Pseudomonadales bacterium]